MIGQCERQIEDDARYCIAYSTAVQRMSDVERCLAHCVQIDGQAAKVKDDRAALEVSAR